MIEGPVAVKPIDVKKGEHLREGVQPIMACVGTGIVDDSGDPLPNTHNIDFYGTPEELNKNGIENGGVNSYVISAVDSSNKYSKKFYDCTGLIIAGKEKGTDKNISFMSHQNPDYFLGNNNIEDVLKFLESLIKQIKIIKDRCEDKTIDAVIVGGRYAEAGERENSHPGGRERYKEEYLASIRFLSAKIKNELGFEPLVIAGPKTVPASDSIFYDNENRKLFLARGADDFGAIQSFTPSELEEIRKTWKPGEWPLLI